MSISYENTMEHIARILQLEYGLDGRRASEAIMISHLEHMFQSDPEMFAHTANEIWAREVFGYWEKVENRHK